ncbi:ring canal kelch homolog [Acyrthosiphon pisum]|uniref:Kelch-like protein diablo n=1 Tax=Acyrthosiphon pisum TaxID=7029 RepID=A0A8R2H5N0_ACYPI|nr:ring canal kelch homolog [Acyrthosiphon pisum]XP_016661409.1 ring canal kelch homolog [Acyrthosiphon pisum]|eukprot:XP_016661407.1 PREDICTED: ring canal kelch homolog [Acyrthosiphon pisum]
MDALQKSLCTIDLKQIMESSGREPTTFKNNSHSARILEDLQSLRKNQVLCDIKLKTDDNEIVYAHKNVLITACPYFRAMFSHFDESNKDLINIRELDSTIIQLLIEYIYTGEIIVTKENVQVLLQAANFLQLDFVTGACVEFLIQRLDPSNCIAIKAIADLYNCMELVSSSDAYIKKHFLEVVKGGDFLSLSPEDLIKLISCNDLVVPFEDKVFECVIKWVKHDLNLRKDFMPELMEHVRLPLLASTPHILNNVVEEPLLKNSPKCKDYVFEALRFNLHKSVEHFTIPQTIRCKPRQFGGSQKVILMFNWSNTLPKCYTEWYDPATKLRKNAPALNDCHLMAGFGVIRDQFVFAVGGVNLSSSKSVSMLDVSSQSPFWVPMVDMLVSRKLSGVGVLGDSIYAAGGSEGRKILKSVEVFDVTYQKWRMVSNMSITRSNLGVGVLNNKLYAVGGWSGSLRLKSAEFYDPGLDTWSPIADMSVSRNGVGIGVLDGVLYAIGGHTGSEVLKSVEAYKPSEGLWTSIADMHLCRLRPGVFAKDGLLYVVGGETEKSIVDTVEIYNKMTDTWTMETLSRCGIQIYGGVVVDRPPHFTSN